MIEEPKIIGWHVDATECVKHGGVGIGITFYVQFSPTNVVPFWWCSVDDLREFTDDKSGYYSVR